MGTSIGVQQKLMRHAQVATTMNVYGNAMMETKREANSKVVQMVLRPAFRVAKLKRAAEAPLFAPFVELPTACNPMRKLVAGAGFEPATFGL
jgi:hypothetical protein